MSRSSWVFWRCYWLSLISPGGPVDMGAGGQGEVGADQSSAGDRVWMLHWSHFGVPGSIGISFHWKCFDCRFSFYTDIVTYVFILNSAFAGNVVIEINFARIVINSCCLLRGVNCPRSQRGFARIRGPTEWVRDTSERHETPFATNSFIFAVVVTVAVIAVIF